MSSISGLSHQNLFEEHHESTKAELLHDLHIHEEFTDSLSLPGCANEFIYNENLRKNFGKFSAKDLSVYNNKKLNRGMQTNDVSPVFKGQ